MMRLSLKHWGTILIGVSLLVGCGAGETNSSSPSPDPATASPAVKVRDKAQEIEKNAAQREQVNPEESQDAQESP